MVEPMLGWAVGLPSGECTHGQPNVDVWALGVLLYKLCYYTTPFEEHGTLAIVNARYTFPQYPVYSPQIQHLIASMLVDHPARRPTVFEVLRTSCDMSGTKPETDYVSHDETKAKLTLAHPIKIVSSSSKATIHQSARLHLSIAHCPCTRSKSPRGAARSTWPAYPGVIATVGSDRSASAAAAYRPDTHPSSRKRGYRQHGRVRHA